MTNKNKTALITGATSGFGVDIRLFIVYKTRIIKLSVTILSSNRTSINLLFQTFIKLAHHEKIF